MTKPVVDAGLVGIVVEVVLGRLVPVAVDGRGGSKDATVGSRGGDGSRVHEGNGAHLPLPGLGALAVGEVARGVANGQAAVSRRVTGAKARAAEGGADDGACAHEVKERPIPRKLHHHGLARRIYREREVPVAAALALEHLGCVHHIGEVTARAATDDALLHLQPPVDDLVEQMELGTAFGHLGGSLLRLAQDVGEVLVELVDLIGVGGVKRQGDHGLDRGEVDPHAAIVIGDLSRVELAVLVRTAMRGKEVAGLVVGAPDGRQTGGLGGHDIHAVAEVAAHARDARPHELHDLVLDVAAPEDRADDGECDVLRSHAWAGLALKVDGNDAGIRHVIGVAEQLLDELAATLADGHRAEGTVAGVRVGAEDHLAAASELLAHVLVDDGDVRGHEDTAVLLGRRETEGVVVLVDGSTHGAQAVVAVREHVRQRETLHTRGLGGLDDAHKGDVVRGHGIEAELQVAHVSRGVVCLHDSIGDGAPACFVRSCGNSPYRRLGSRHDLCAVDQIDVLIVKLDHNRPLLESRSLRLVC